MATPARSPVLGYNHNLKYRGRVFHVQTEDSGPGHPRIFTHLYSGGSIVASKKTEYDAAAPPDIVKGLMQSQHKSILRDLKNGRHDAQLKEFFARRGEQLDVLDDTTDENPTVNPGDSSPGLMEAPAPIVSDLADTLVNARRSDSVSPEVLAQFEHAFDDEPSSDHAMAALPTKAPAASPTAFTPPPARAQPTIPVRPIPPAQPSTAASVKVERTVPVGANATGPVPTRPKRPGHSIPYVVQQGSHPVAPAEGEQEVHVPTLTMPAAPIVPRAKRATEPGLAAKNEAAIKATVPAVASVVVPPVPPAPLDPATATTTAPITAAAAATVGATPTEMVSREDNQSLDEVIMAYLARGVEDDQKNVGS